MNIGRILFLSHGGGPLPLLGDAGHREMVACLEALAARLPRPDAIVVVSAHWEAAMPTLIVSAAPSLLYDYYGFPPESYEIRYPCSGEPALARRIHALLGEAGVDAALDDTRGFDHGVFVPLKIMYPRADIPCVQLSLLDSLDPQQHLEMGCALRALRQENILFIGSGFSFHNMQQFFRPATAEARALNLAFDGWLQETCRDVAPEEAWRRLTQWEAAPGARFCHPREEHLLPLHVCYGLAGEPCAEVLDLEILGKQASMYLW